MGATPRASISITLLYSTSFLSVFLCCSFFPGGTHAKKSLYGEPCNVGQKCDARSYLSCQDGICGCIKPEEMIYEKTYGKCVSKSGERCRFAVDEQSYPHAKRSSSSNGNGNGNGNRNGGANINGNGNGSRNNNNNNSSNNTKQQQQQAARRARERGPETHNLLIFEPTLCVPNANCTVEGICVCELKYYEDPSGTGLCILGQGHLEPCDSLIKCSDHQRLTCVEGRCQCDKSKSIYSMKSLMYYNNRNNPNPTSANDNNSHCVGLPGHPCIHGKCTLHSTCSNPKFGSPPMPICKCDEDYFHDPQDDRCVKKLGHLQNCTQDFQCERKSGNQFICLKGQCVCDPTVSKYGAARASLKYDDDFSRFHGYTGPTSIHCVGLVASDCIEGLCTTNAFCSYANSEVNDASGICRCTPEFSESKTRACGKDFYQYCDPYTCIDDFICYESRCACRYENQIYDNSSKTCKSQIGGPCNNATFSCGPKAECQNIQKNNAGNPNRISNQNQNPNLAASSASSASSINNLEEIMDVDGKRMPRLVIGGHGHCTCMDGYIENSRGICEKSYGKSCEDNSECDTVALLKCMDGTCQCRGFAEYSERFRKCLGLVGAKCNVTEMVARQCTDHAECTQSHPDMPGICKCKENFGETTRYNCVKRGGGGKP